MPLSPSTAPCQSTSLARVQRGNLCAGCGGCEGLFPDQFQMRDTAPGFLRPVQTGDVSAQQDAAFAAMCPGLGQTVTLQAPNNPPLWGPFAQMWTGWATDPEIRFAGASGGALSMIALHLVEAGIVDEVVQIKASPAIATANTTVISTTRDDVLAAAGSRYASSAPLSGLHAQVQQHRAAGTRFAFVGKPCDAAALGAIRSQDPEVAAAFPVILSFFCAGVPSQTGVRAVVQALGLDPDRLARFRFRGNGWPGRATAVDDQGKEASMSYHDSWGKILSKHVQHRCKICADGTGMAADIVCADAWESDAAGYPVFSEAPGVSLIVARTALGETLITGARDAGRIETQPFDVATLVDIQPGQRERRRALFARLAALRLAGRPIPRYTGLHIGAVARQNPVMRNLKNFLGTLRRTVMRK